MFDYLSEQPIADGCRVLVPFGPRTLLGIVIGQVERSDIQQTKLKPIQEVLDHQPVLDATQLTLCRWLSQYYQHPLGEALQTALPVALRKGEQATPKEITWLRLTEQGEAADDNAFGRAKKQQQLWHAMFDGEVSQSTLTASFSRTVIDGLIKKGLIETFEQAPKLNLNWTREMVLATRPVASVEQAVAISALHQRQQGFSCSLLEGVTGSGKTEVYLQAIEPILQAGRQVLILVPEIGLTPQTVARFRHRFGIEIGVLHSNLTDNERLAVWQQAREGALGIIIGTRSAIFTPMAKPGMIIVDEEHDNSYKQQDGLRYHARDLAVMRAREEHIPLLLGTATPSLESLNNALSGRYLHFQLHQRAGSAVHTRQQVLDIRNQRLQFGLANAMIERMEWHLRQGNQVMLFVNRRGYAPALICHQCGHVEECRRCERSYTLHHQQQRLQCHHCGSSKGVPHTCHDCGASQWMTSGVGTEQLEKGLSELFPHYASVRIDSDSARGKTKLQDLLDKVNRNQYQLLIGTQILSKGHHFPHVTLVVILDVDGALYSGDFRAAEHLCQLVTQLAGRAGRAEKAGEMWLQTHHPEHPLLQDLVHNGYAHFARHCLMERKHAGLPPYSYQVLVRAEAPQAQHGFEFLYQARQLLMQTAGIQAIGPLPALMEKRQGRYRMQLVLQSQQRRHLQQALQRVLPELENLPLARKVRWSVDVDPQDFS